MKRGETIKTWRKRYFYLLSDGSLLGFKTRKENQNFAEASSNFTVNDCQLMWMDRPKPNSFTLKGLQVRVRQNHSFDFLQ